MYSSVVGIIDGEKYLKMKKVWATCDEAGIAIPEEVLVFFGYEPPKPHGMEVMVPVIKDDSVEMENSLIVRLDEIPEGVVAIKFTNSY